MSKRSLKSTNDDKDEPPMSRLFVVLSKDTKENEIRGAFQQFGEIEDVRILKEKDGVTSKGVSYIKFRKTSEAAVACEEMNGKTIGNTSRPIKVLIAASRQMGSASAKSREEEKAQRLFIITPKNFTTDNLYEEFSKYGDIEDVNVIRDRQTKDGKGFAYIKYKKFSSAALAFENCDEKYKAVFAEPKPFRSSTSSLDNSSGTSSNYDDRKSYNFGSIGSEAMVNNSSDCALHVICSPMITHDQLWRLFDIVPNMDFCKMNAESDFSSSATVVYRTPQAAMHAKMKLHGFEYPLGERLIVKLSSEMKSLPNASEGAQTQNPFYNDISSGMNFSSVSLPPPQPLAPSQSPCAQRCFIVCTPHSLPIHVLKKVFCRFGNLIDVYLLNNRNCGYVKFASTESARQAMKVLHGAEIYGVRLKVLEAEEPEPRKRSKMDD